MPGMGSVGRRERDDPNGTGHRASFRFRVSRAWRMSRDTLERSWSLHRGNRALSRGYPRRRVWHGGCSLR
jgi:hypothetical protein